MLCALGGDGGGAAGCDMNWNFWGVGSRLQWDITKSFYASVSKSCTTIWRDGLLHGFKPQEEAEG